MNFRIRVLSAAAATSLIKAGKNVRNFSELLSRMSANKNRTALIDAASSWSYADLLLCSAQLAQAAASSGSSMSAGIGDDGSQQRIAVLCPRDHQYVASMLATWRMGCIAVPLPDSSPAAELADNYVSDAAPSLLLASRVLAPKAEELARLTGTRVHWVEPTSPAAVASRAKYDATSAHASGSSSPLGVGSSGAAGALMVYTSGTTGKPKGVLTSCSALVAQITALTSAWEWSPTDRILHVLPLHHVHGIMAKLLCALWSGAAVEMMPRFVPEQVWEALSRVDSSGAAGAGAADGAAPRNGASSLSRPAAAGSAAGSGAVAFDSAARASEGKDTEGISVFMAVPTVYSKLLEALEAAPPATRERWTRPLLTRSTPMRLMVSGSAALPVPVMQRWRSATGHTLLERFGMSEFGLAISNPYREDAGAGRVRTPGAVGTPLPGFEARIVDVESGKRVAPGESGELLIRGPAMMTEYWGRPAATEESFALDDDDCGSAAGSAASASASKPAAPAGAGKDNSRRWFRTGDSARADPATGYITIEGRLSADIIKSSGKLSALEIERHLLEHEAVGEVAVFGTPDETYGESVVALVVPRPGSSQAAQLAAGGCAPSGPGSSGSSGSSLMFYASAAASELSAELRAWAKGQMAAYKAPAVVRWVPEIPRNAMLKVNKKSLRIQYAAAAN